MNVNRAITGRNFVGVDLGRRTMGGVTWRWTRRGVGRPVVDMLQRAGLEAMMLPAIITGGAAETLGNGYYRVPKRDPIAGRWCCNAGGTDSGGVEARAGPDGEMVAMRVKVGGDGREQYGA